MYAALDTRTRRRIIGNRGMNPCIMPKSVVYTYLYIYVYIFFTGVVYIYIHIEVISRIMEKKMGTTTMIRFHVLSSSFVPQ